MQANEPAGIPFDPKQAGLKLDASTLARFQKDLGFGDEEKCPSCGSSEHYMLTQTDRYGFDMRYVACRSCGLVFANPYYDAASLDTFYSGVYAQVYGRKARPEDMFAAELQRGKNAAKIIHDYAQANGLKPKSCLDLGCSHGGFLAALPEDWLKVGYDYDESLFQLGRDQGFDLRSIMQLDHEFRRFDIVMANQVLEHTADPVAFLKKMAAFLSPEGFIYIEVPGLRSPSAAHVDIRLMFKNAHRFLFDASTLQKVAYKAGLSCAYLDETVQTILMPCDRAKSVIPSRKYTQSAPIFIAERIQKRSELKAVVFGFSKRISRAIKRRFA